MQSRFLLVVLLVSTSTLFAQTQEEKLAERAANKVELFTPKENDNLQRFYGEEVAKMKLTEAERDEYFMILGYYTNKMGRIGSKNTGYSDSEVKTKFHELIGKLNVDMHEMLTDEQYEIHKASFEKIIQSVYNRKGWKH